MTRFPSKLFFSFFSFFSLTLSASDSCPKRLQAHPAGEATRRALSHKPASLLVSADGASLYVGTESGEVLRMSTSSLAPMPFGTRDTIRPYSSSTLLAPYGDRILGLSGDFLLEIGTGSNGFGLLKRLPETAKAIATAPAQDRIAIAFDSGRVTVYRGAKPGSLKDLNEEQTFVLPRSWPFSWNPFLRDSVSAIALSPDGDLLAVAFRTPRRSYVYVWSLETGKLRFSLTRDSLRTEEGHLSSMDGNPDCTALGFVGNEQLYTAWSTYRSFFQNWVEKIFLWETHAGSLVKNIGHSHFTSEAPFPGNITSVAFTPDRQAVAIGRSGSQAFFSRVSVYSIHRTRVATLVGHAAPVAFVAFSPNAKELFSLSETGELVRWDAGRVLAAHQERFTFAGDFLVTPRTARVGGRLREDSGE